MSRRRGIAVLQSLLGPEVSNSSTQVNRATEQLDARLSAWRGRPLDETQHVFLYASFEKVHDAGRLVDCGVLVTFDITRDGHRRVLCVSVAVSEAEGYWRALIDSVIRRGLNGSRLSVSEDHDGLNAARSAALPGVSWQRCQFNLQHHARAHTKHPDQRRPVSQRTRSICNAPDRAEAGRLPKQAVQAWTTDAPMLAQWAEDNLPAGLTAFNSLDTQRMHQRATNGLERINREIKRRTCVISIFPNTAFCLRIAPRFWQNATRNRRLGKFISICNVITSPESNCLAPQGLRTRTE